MPFRRFPDPPEPVSAEQTSATAIAVSFSEGLVAGVLDESNWVAQAGLLAVPAVNVQAAGAVVLVTMGSSGTFDSVSYDPPPFDVVSSETGREAEAFSGFPVM